MAQRRWLGELVHALCAEGPDLIPFLIRWSLSTAGVMQDSPLHCITSDSGHMSPPQRPLIRNLGRCVEALWVIDYSSVEHILLGFILCKGVTSQDTLEYLVVSFLISLT